MSLNKALMFNRKAAAPKSQADRVVKSLDLKQGQTVIDIGAGGGYFAFQFALRVGPTGAVFAVDVNEEFLQFIAQQARDLGLRNLKTLPAGRLSKISGGSADLIFFRDVYHHLKDRSAYAAALKRLLKPEGRIAVVEYRSGGGLLNLLRRPGHYVKPGLIIDEMQAAGYRAVQSFDFLSEQSFTIFARGP